MYHVNKIKTDKNAYLPLLLLSGKPQSFFEDKFADADLYVLSSGQIPVSAALLELQETRCIILAIATDEAHRNQGFAARLVEYLKDDYMRKASTIEIEVPKGSALPFYQLGFHSKDDATEPILMIKDLKELD